MSTFKDKYKVAANKNHFMDWFWPQLSGNYARNLHLHVYIQGLTSCKNHHLIVFEQDYRL